MPGSQDYLFQHLLEPEGCPYYSSVQATPFAFRATQKEGCLYAERLPSFLMLRRKINARKFKHILGLEKYDCSMNYGNSLPQFTTKLHSCGNLGHQGIPPAESWIILTRTSPFESLDNIMGWRFTVTPPLLKKLHARKLQSNLKFHRMVCKIMVWLKHLWKFLRNTKKYD